MKNIIKVVFALLVVLFVTSCEKEDNYPRQYYRGELMSDDLKMYTNDGEITNQQVINDFVKRQSDFLLSIHPNSSYEMFSSEEERNLYDNYNCELVFYASNSGQVISTTDEKNSFKFSLKRKEGYVNLSMNDTIQSLITGDEKPVYRCTPEVIDESVVPLSNGMGTIQKILRPMYAKQVNGEIHIALVSYLETVHYNNELRQANYRGPVNNMINPDYISALRESSPERRDTIVYRESYIVFKE